jgi:hypothetical protein
MFEHRKDSHLGQEGPEGFKLEMANEERAAGEKRGPSLIVDQILAL